MMFLMCFYTVQIIKFEMLYGARETRRMEKENFLHFVLSLGGIALFSLIE